ncbi:MAG: nucleotidyltransferase domain-containing protein [Anaerolineales bacterium]
MLVWPDREQVDQAVRAWALEARRRHPRLVRLGYFGSYARGDWGVGSDLDLVAVVEDSSEPFERRPLRWDLSRLPVPAEILIYTRGEWERLMEGEGRFARILSSEVVWLYAVTEARKPAA